MSEGTDPLSVRWPKERRGESPVSTHENPDPPSGKNQAGFLRNVGGLLFILGALTVGGVALIAVWEAEMLVYLLAGVAAAAMGMLLTGGRGSDG